MHRYLRQASIATALAAGIGAALAQAALTEGALAQPAPTVGADRQEGVNPAAQLALTPTQKAAIYAAVKQADVQSAAPPSTAPPTVAVGAQLPPSIELHVLPDAALAQAPETKMLQYTMVDRQVVLVDPTTMRVVDVIRE